MSHLISMEELNPSLQQQIQSGGSGGASTTVVDNLDSQSPVSALSARQGKILNQKLIVTDTTPTDLTHTGVVFLRKSKPYEIPIAPIN